MTYSNSDNAAINHFTHYKGDTFPRTLIFQSDTLNDGIFSDDDITADTFRMHVRCPKTGRLVLAFEIGKGFTIVDNKLVMLKTALQMNSVEGGTYKYDLEQTFADGTVKTRMKGLFIINADETY